MANINVMDLIYWKDTERTGMVFTGLVVGLLSLFQLSIITVISTISLGVLCFTVSVSLYYKILQVLNMGDGVHPFKAYLDLDISFSGELADQYTQKTIVNNFVSCLFLFIVFTVECVLVFFVTVCILLYLTDVLLAQMLIIDVLTQYFSQPASRRRSTVC